jgi:hypothetical protein
VDKRRAEPGRVGPAVGTAEPQGGAQPAAAGASQAERVQGSGDTISISGLTSGLRSKSGTSKLVGFRPGVVFGDFAKGHNVRLALVAEVNAVAAAARFNTRQRCGSNVAATLLPIFYQGVQLGQVAIGRRSMVPKVGLEPTSSCEDRILSPARLP